MALAKPLVTIGLPVYNGGRYIRRALESLLGQAYGPIELIISDNASTDDTSAICQEFAERDSRVRYYRNPSNIGINANFRRVVRFASGAYFVWAACDDMWDAQFLETLVSGLIAHPRHGVAMSSFIWIRDDGTEHETILFDGELDITTLPPADVLRRMLQVDGPRKSWAIHTFIYGVFHTKLLKQLLNRPIPSCMAGDRIMMAELALATRFVSVKDILYFKTWHNQPLAERYSDEDLGKQWKDRRRWTKYALTMNWRLLTSQLIPWRQKLTVVVPALCRFNKLHRRRILEEWRSIFGMKSGIEAALKHFDERVYLEQNPDVHQALKAGRIATPIEHFMRFGFQENRTYAQHQLKSR